MAKPTIYSNNLDKSPANYTPLSPLSFIDRAADVYPEYTSVIHGELTYTWSETRDRCVKLASALSEVGVSSGDTVAVLAANIPALFEAHFGIPMCGAVLNAINTRLDAATIAFILEHGEAKVLLTDTEYYGVVSKALASMESPPIVIDIEDPVANSGERLGTIRLADDRPSALPVDSADVSLQRLVLSMDAGSGGRYQHLHSRRFRTGHSSRHPRAPDYPSLRRTDCTRHDYQHTKRPTECVRLSNQCYDCSSTTSCFNFTINGVNGVSHDARLWPDRNLRASCDVRLEGDVGQGKRREQSPTKSAARGSLSGTRRIGCDGS